MEIHLKVTLNSPHAKNAFLSVVEDLVKPWGKVEVQKQPEPTPKKKKKVAS